MYPSLALALEILPLLRANTLRGLIRTSGYYAFRSGQTAAHVEHAMHLIGAACVLTRVPVAPVHYVDDLHDEWRRIFTVAAADSDYANAWPLICDSSRHHVYSEADFERVATVVRTQLAKYALLGQAPLGLWRLVVEQSLARALMRYEQIVAAHQTTKGNSAWPTLGSMDLMPSLPPNLHSNGVVGGPRGAPLPLH